MTLHVAKAIRGHYEGEGVPMQITSSEIALSRKTPMGNNLLRFDLEEVGASNAM